MRDHNYFIYILTNIKRTVLYTGVTNDLSIRLKEHKANINPTAFTSRYKCYYLLHFERYTDIGHAIEREKEIKGWSREKKINLIKATNPELVFINNNDII